MTIIEDENDRFSGKVATLRRTFWTKNHYKNYLLDGDIKISLVVALSKILHIKIY